MTTVTDEVRPGQVYELRAGRGLPYPWRVESVLDGRVTLYFDGTRKTVKQATLRKDYRRVKET